MAYCPNCGNEIKLNNKFCAACGYRVNPVIAHSIAEKSVSKEKPKRKWGLGFITTILLSGAVYFGYVNYNPNAEDMLLIQNEVTGMYKDKSGMLTGSNAADIKVEFENNRLMGRNTSGSLTFKLKPLETYKYKGEVDRNGFVSDFEVTFNTKKKRLVFEFGHLSRSFYLEKVE